MLWFPKNNQYPHCSFGAPALSELVHQHTGAFGCSSILHGSNPVCVLNGIDSASLFGTCAISAEGASASLLGDVVAYLVLFSVDNYIISNSLVGSTLRSPAPASLHLLALQLSAKLVWFESTGRISVLIQVTLRVCKEWEFSRQSCAEYIAIWWRILSVSWSIIYCSTLAYQTIGIHIEPQLLIMQHWSLNINVLFHRILWLEVPHRQLLRPNYCVFATCIVEF